MDMPTENPMNPLHYFEWTTARQQGVAATHHATRAKSTMNSDVVPRAQKNLSNWGGGIDNNVALGRGTQ